LRTRVSNENDIHDEIKEHTEFEKCLPAFSSESLSFCVRPRNLKSKTYLLFYVGVKLGLSL